MRDSEYIMDSIIPASAGVPAKNGRSAFCLLAISFSTFIFIFILGDFIEELSLNGISDGFGMAISKSIGDVFFFGIVWGIIILPLNLAALLFCKLLHRQKLRTLLTIGPSVGLLLITLVLTLIDWPTPRRQFKREAGISLPASARDFHSHFIHYSLGDIADEYWFECDPADTQKIITALNLEQDKEDPVSSAQTIPAGWHGAKTWKGMRVYHRTGSGGFSSYTLLTDEGGTQVYLSVKDG